MLLVEVAKLQNQPFLPAVVGSVQDFQFDGCEMGRSKFHHFAIVVATSAPLLTLGWLPRGASRFEYPENLQRRVART